MQNNVQLTNADEMFCSTCGNIIKKATEICPHCGVRQKARPQEMKNPGIAAIASFFFAGLGQIYNGEFVKAIAFMVVQVINILLMFVLIGFLTYPIVWIFGIYDAYKTAEKINAGMVE